MKHQINMDLLKQVDETTEERIAEEFPFNLEKEELFERAYQHYLEQSPESEFPDEPLRHSRNQLYRSVGLAACLLLTVGLGLGVWSRQQRAESRPVLETTTTTHTETQTETTVQTAAISHTTESIPAPVSKTAPVSMEMTESARIIPPVSTQSVLPAMTSPVHEPTDPSTAAATGVTIVTEPSDVSKATEIIPTEPKESDPAEPTGSTTDIPESILLNESLLPWFVIEQVNGYTQIRSMLAVEPSPEEWVTYAVESDLFTVTETRKHRSCCEYRILVKDSARVLTVWQYARTAFIQGWSSDWIPEVVHVGENIGYIWTDAENEECGLVWDDGKYTFVVETSIQNSELLLMVAEATQ